MFMAPCQSQKQSRTNGKYKHTCQSLSIRGVQNSNLAPAKIGRSVFHGKEDLCDRLSTTLPDRVTQLRIGGTTKAVVYNGEKCHNTAFQKIFSDFSIFLVRIPSLAALIIVKRFNLNCSLHSC